MTVSHNICNHGDTPCHRTSQLNDEELEELAKEARLLKKFKAGKVR